MATTEKAVAEATPIGPNASANERSTVTQFAPVEHPPAPGITRRGTQQRRPTTETTRTNSRDLGRASTMGSRGPGLNRRTTSLFEPAHKVAVAPPFWQGLKAIILASWFNVLLIFIPVSWALHFAKPDLQTPIFIVSFLAIIPLAKLLAFATEEISLRTSQTIGGLLNATLGNAVELIVAIIALTKCELQIVQSSLIGSILSNLLLVLGMCFFAGGTRFSEQGFGISAAQLNSTLLVIAVIAVLLPAAFDFAVTSGPADDTRLQFDILHLSHGIAILLLIIYGLYIVFQLKTHTHLYEDKNTDEVMVSKKYIRKPKKEKKSKKDKDSNGSALTANGDGVNAHGTNGTTVTHGSSEATDVESAEAAHEEEVEEEEEEVPQTSFALAAVLLAVVTVLVAITAEFLVDSIDGLTQSGNISKEFVGIILLAIVGNAAEHATAVTVSFKDKLTLSIGVAVGSSIQIALFVIPFIVTLAWIMGKPLTLLFDPLESIVLFFAVLTVNYVVADGKSNWLEGAILFMLYVICAVIFWFYPGSDPTQRYKDLTCNPKTR